MQKKVVTKENSGETKGMEDMKEKIYDREKLWTSNETKERNEEGTQNLS